MADAHSRIFRKRACDRCRISKSRCDRRSVGCTRCVASGKVCVYAVPDCSFKVRNETGKAERHAVSAWRARATKTTCTSQRATDSHNSCRLQQPIATKVQELARHRFVYDFSESKSGLLAMSFGDLSRTTTMLSNEHTAAVGLDAALAATSLANFYARHQDTRAVSAATSALSKALQSLGHTLKIWRRQPTVELVLAAILLGLHQNISHEKHLIGSWVHHFRGSVNLLEAAVDHGLDRNTYLSLSRLMENQALCIGLAVGIPFCLPARMRKNLAAKTDLRSRTLSLAAIMADFCARVTKMKMHTEVLGQVEVRKQFDFLNSAFDRLKTELSASIPYHRQKSRAELYPKWYQIISAYPGGPRYLDTYAAAQDAAIWNMDRMARIKLLLLALDLGLPECSILLTLSNLVEDVCASIYFILSYKLDGSRTLSCFDEIAGSKAYSLISPIAVAFQCLESQPCLEHASERLLWLKNVLAVFRERLGISYAWCWKDGDEVDARLRIERELSFDGLV